MARAHNSLVVAVFSCLICCGTTFADRIIAIENVTQNLHEVDPVTFTVTPLGASGIPDTVFGAASSGDPGFIYATTTTGLYRVDVDNNTSVLVGNYSGAATEMRELAYRPAANQLLGTNYTNLFEIDQTTAACTAIGSHNGPNAVWAMTLVPGVGVRGISAGIYYNFSVLNGVAIQLGTSTSGILDFAYDPASGTLIGATNAQMYTFDVATGASTAVGPATIPNMLGWALVKDAVAGSDFRRGDINGDGSVNLQDAIGGLTYLFTPGGAVPDCLDTADSNDDGSVNLPDVVALLSYLFVPSSPIPAAPGPVNCGPDVGTDMLDPCSYASC
ncbi:MAG: dockerin type I repeat-containing protein [Planctomycetota bacterium]